MRPSSITPLLALAVLAALPIRADACTCMAFPDDPAAAAELAYERADVVFLGTALETETKLASTPRARITRFSVEKSWKGLGGAKDAMVRSAVSEAACGIRFQTGLRYLVFAYRDGQREYLTTGLCELNRREKAAADILSALDRIAAKPGPTAP